jgi:hypothetical protein
VLLKDKMRDANKMPKGSKRLLGEALGSFHAAKRGEARQVKGSLVRHWDCSVLLKEKRCDAGKMPKGGKRLLREALGSFCASEGRDARR